MIGNCGLALVDQLLDGAPGLVDRDREADADVAGLAAELAAADGGDGRVDADDLAVEVDQRAAGVAGVDRGVGLDRVDVGAVAGSAARSPAVTGRFLALTMPLVTVPDRPSGEPMASTGSPTTTLSELPSGSAGRFLASTWSTARS